MRKSYLYILKLQRVPSQEYLNMRSRYNICSRSQTWGNHICISWSILVKESFSCATPDMFKKLTNHEVEVTLPNIRTCLWDMSYKGETSSICKVLPWSYIDLFLVVQCFHRYLYDRTEDSVNVVIPWPGPNVQ